MLFIKYTLGDNIVRKSINFSNEYTLYINTENLIM